MIDKMEKVGLIKAEIKKPIRPARGEEDFYYVEITKL
jgi:hypothetical protein